MNILGSKAVVDDTKERNMDKARTVVRESIDSVSEAARPTLDHLASSAHTAVDRAGVVANHAARTVVDKAERLNATGQKLIGQAGGFVRENPVASLGMLVATGYFLKWIFSNR